MTGVLRTWTRPIALAVLAVLLAGCRGEVVSRVVVADVDRAQVRVSVLFSGDAAVAVARGSQLAELATTFEARTGATPDPVRDGDVVGVAADLDYDQLVGLADVTSLAALELAPVGDGTTVLTARVVEPTDLARAVADAAGDDVVGAAFGGATRTVVELEFPGGITRVDAPDTMPVEVSDTVVRIDQAVGEVVAGTVVVHGSPGGGLPSWLLWGAAAALIVGAVALARRRIPSRAGR